jgi:hypothetical protein
MAGRNRFCNTRQRNVASTTDEEDFQRYGRSVPGFCDGEEFTEATRYSIAGATTGINDEKSQFWINLVNRDPAPIFKPFSLSANSAVAKPLHMISTGALLHPLSTLPIMYEY